MKYILLFLLLIVNAYADQLEFTRIIDGDTIVFNDNLKCRVLGIDTPESIKGKKLNTDVLETKIPKEIHLNAGLLSKEYATNYFKKLSYDVKIVEKDLYGRNLCIIEKYNCDILKDGYAVVYKKGKLTKDKDFRKHLNECQDQGLNKGLNIDYKELMEKLRN